MRPPWALPEAEFLARCTRCNNCAIICPAKIITMNAGYPEVHFSAAACTFCGECVRVCAPGALHRDETSKPWQIHAGINDSCLAQRGVECRICGEHCEAEAIQFPQQRGVAPAPVVDAARCTGCGACVSACPSKSITVA